MPTKEALNKAAATISFVAATTTKQILKYGAANQVADILNGRGGTKFEADQRVKVIREYISRATAYLPHLKDSDPMEQQAFMTGFDAILALYYRAGNCGENSAVSFCLLEQLATAGPFRQWLTDNRVRMDYWRLDFTGEHSFCVIRLETIPAKPENKDSSAMEVEDDDTRVIRSDPIICDPWAKDKHVTDMQNFFMNDHQALTTLPSIGLDHLKAELSKKSRLDPAVGKRLNLMELAFNIFCNFLAQEDKNTRTYFKNKKSITGAQREVGKGDWDIPHPGKDLAALLNFENENLNFDANPGQKQFTAALLDQLHLYVGYVYGTLTNYIAHASLFFPGARG